MNYMKKKTFYSTVIYLPVVVSLWVSCAMLSLMGCSMNEILIQDYIELSENSYTFDVSGNDRLTITVHSGAEWNITPYESDWITAENRTSTSVTLVAAGNTNMNARSCEILFVSGGATAAVTLHQIGLDPGIAKFTLMNEYNGGMVISPNGKCIAGVFYESDNDYTYYTAVRIFTDTGRRDVLENRSTSSISVRTVSDNGVVAIGTNDGISTYYDVNGKNVTPSIPSDYRSPNIYGISSDGSVMVGFASDPNRNYVPCKWVNGTFEQLPTPTMDILGENPISPYLSFYARGCSADGTVIYGSGSTSYEAIYWKNDEVDWVGKNMAEKKTIVLVYSFWGQTIEYETEIIEQAKINATNMNISPNGKYIVGQYTVYDASVKPATTTIYPFFFDTETDEIKLIKEFPNNDPDGGTALTASNDGLITYTTYDPQVNGAITLNFNSDGFVYDVKKGTSITTSAYLQQTFGIFLAKVDTYILRYSLDANLLFGQNKEQTALGYFYPVWMLKW